MRFLLIHHVTTESDDIRGIYVSAGFIELVAEESLIPAGMLSLQLGNPYEVSEGPGAGFMGEILDICAKFSF